MVSLDLVDKIATVLLLTLLWVMIGRFKRVEVQVVQNDQETTYGIFKKLRLLQFNQIAFLIIVLSFLIPSGASVNSSVEKLLEVIYSDPKILD